MNRDNIPSFVLDRPWKVVLVPGAVIQWLIYMSPERGLSGVARTARRARSPIMTYWYSFWFYAILTWLIWSGLLIKLLLVVAAWVLAVIGALFLDLH